MNLQNFKNKKIGIWGYGKVGTSYLHYIQDYTTSISIMDKNPIYKEQLNPSIQFIVQTPESIETFLQSNDYILISPGVNIGAYEKYKYKFISELDIFSHLWEKPMIAITGTLGKSTITSLGAQLLQKYGIQAQAMGNIGYPMLEGALNQKNTEVAVVELSSFQLAHAHDFKPDISIWTNVFENHLDYHGTLEHYKNSKKNICSYQTESQISILHADLAQDCSHIASIIHWICNSAEQAYALAHKNMNHFAWYIDEQKNIILLHNSSQQRFINLNQLPALTFAENWVILCALLYAKNLNIQLMPEYAQNLTLPAHRLYSLGTIHNKTFYNDSKSTLWQATYKALQSLPTIPTIIFVGGISKGVDRTPFFANLNPLLHIVYAFGKEADYLHDLCMKYNITCKKFDTLEQAFQMCIQEPFDCNVLFSPGGASYDLFKDFEDRGNRFKYLVQTYENMVKQEKSF